jgi:hypothetical protein
MSYDRRKSPDEPEPVALREESQAILLGFG